MQPKILLRIAAVAITIFDLGHTVGGMMLHKSHGADEDAVLASLAAYHFDMMGSSRSHLDFYAGEGWYLSATLTAMIVLCWQLSSAAAESPALVRRISWLMAAFFATSTLLCVRFFFIAPLLTSAIAAAACAAAALRLRDA